MKSLITFFMCCALSLTALTGFAQQEATRPSFQNLIQESGMQFNQPEGFHEVNAQISPLFPHEFALANTDGSLEIRFAIRPLSRIKVDYQDPHSSTPDPNHMFPLMFQSLVTRLSNGGHSPTREYPADQATKQFHAHWAAASVFDLHPEMRGDHTQGLLIAMHKNRLADAYVLYLFNDYQPVKEEINRLMSVLSFLP